MMMMKPASRNTSACLAAESPFRGENSRPILRQQKFSTNSHKWACSHANDGYDDDDYDDDDGDDDDDDNEVHI